MAKQRQTRDEGGTATIDAPAANAEMDARSEDFLGVSHDPPALRQPCVGLPVQYHTPQGPIPGVLQRQSIADKSLWDVKISLSGASVMVLRSGVRFAEAPTLGCWTFLPGW